MYFTTRDVWGTQKGLSHPTANATHVMLSHVEIRRYVNLILLIRGGYISDAIVLGFF